MGLATFLVVVVVCCHCHCHCHYITQPHSALRHRSSLQPSNCRLFSESASIGPAPSSSSSANTFSSAALIAGTTIGGGFLALPSVTAPVGAIPATMGLSACWLYLLFTSLTLSNTVFLLSSMNTEDTVNDGVLSIFSIAQTCFGNTVGNFAGFLFLVLMTSTLIAQLSKVGLLFETLASGIINKNVTIIAFAALVSFISSRSRLAEHINDALTLLMLTSFTALVSMAGSAGWSASGLQRANYDALIPALVTGGHGHQGPWAIPIFLQLLVYSEIIPLICTRLKSEQEVRKAIVLGSAVPLIMCLVWTFIALGLVPYDHFSITKATHIFDPVNVLLQQGGVGSSSGTWLVGQTSLPKVIVSQSVTLLAFSAISTTLIGGLLSTSQFFEDVITSVTGPDRSQSLQNSASEV